MIVRKGQLARELGVGVESIRRAIREGMPLRWDGRIDRTAALVWLRVYGTPRLREASASAGDLLGTRLDRLAVTPRRLLAVADQAISRRPLVENLRLIK